MSKKYDVGISTAYGAAVRGGYAGTYEQFCADLARLAEVLEEFLGFSVTVQTLAEGQQATASYENGVLSLGIPKGDTGNGIQSISLLSTVGLVKTYRITYTNESHFDFPVADGKGIQSTVLNSDYTLTITYTDGTTWTSVSIRGQVGATPHLTIGTVETLPPSQSASATITGTDENPVLNLGIPKGDTGEVSQSEFDALSHDVDDLTRHLNDLEPVVNDHADEIAYLMSKHFESRDGYKQSMKMWFDSQGAAAMSSAGLTALCDKWYAATRDNWNGWTTFYQPDVSDVSTGTRGGDNAGMICEPSTDTYAGRDDYAALPLFACVDVNYDIDATTLDVVITAIDGVAGNFERDNPDKLVGVMQMTGWVWTEENEETYTVGYSAQRVYGKDQCWPLPESIRPADNSMREFVVHTKYMGHWDGAKMTACAGALPTAWMARATYLTRFKAGGTGRGGGSVLLWTFLILMTYIKYASLTQDGVIQGCVNYNYQYASVIGETGVNRILITPAQAETLKVGSGVLLGHVGASNGIDRTDNAQVYDISGQAGCTITGIEEVEIDGVTYAAVTTDYDGTFDTVGNGTIVTGNTLISTYAWPNGTNDNILGNDGSKEDPGSGVYPAKIQGIEYATGQYEEFGDVLLYFVDADTDHARKWLQYRVCRRGASQGASYTTAFDPRIVEHDLQTPLSSNGWAYIRKMSFAGGYAFPQIVTGGSSATFTRDAIYLNSSRSTVNRYKRLYAFGVLGNGSEPAGLSCAGGNIEPSYVTWIVAGRPSACANRGEWTA